MELKKQIYDPYNQIFPKDQKNTTALRTNHSNGNAWVIPKLTSTPKASTKNITQTTLTGETPQKLKLKNFQNFNSWLQDFHAKHSALQENGKDLTIQEEHSFLKSQGFSRTKDPDIFYSKTWQVYYLMTMEKLSRQSLGFLPTWGMVLNGRCLTARTSGFPKTGKGCSLSDILEDSVEEKYFLSLEATEKILGSLRE